MFIFEKIGPNLYHIILDTEGVNGVVAEISRGRGWELHYRSMANVLKPAAHAQLKAFGEELIALIKVTERLTA